VTRAHDPVNLSGPSSSRSRHPSSETPPRLRDPAPYYRDSASLEGWTPPQAKLHLARGLDTPSGETPPRSRTGAPRAKLRLTRGLDAPSGRNSASLEGWTPPRAKPASLKGWTPPRRDSASLEGWMPPRARLRLARGLCAPSGGSTLRSGPPRVHRSRTHSHDRSI
jgi:hypothetical protein